MYFKAFSYSCRKEKQKRPTGYFSACLNASAATLDEVATLSYLESVVGHCQVEQEVPGIVLGCFMNKFYMEKNKKRLKKYP